MYLLLIILRLIHIFAGVFWAGAALLLAGFVEPTVRSLGDEGGRFMQRLTGSSRLPTYMNLAAILSSFAGAILFWIISGGFSASWLGSAPGVGLSIGAVASAGAFVSGYAIQARSASRIASLGREIQAQGAPPTSSQLTEMHSLQSRLRLGGVLGAVLLSIAVISMATARYLYF
jgi:uncharacterized membrane protein